MPDDASVAGRSSGSLERAVAAALALGGVHLALFGAAGLLLSPPPALPSAALALFSGIALRAGAGAGGRSLLAAHMYVCA